MKRSSIKASSRFNILISVICLALLSGLATTAAAKGKPGPGADPATIRISYGGQIGGSVSCDEKLNADTTILGCNHYGGFTFAEDLLGFFTSHPICFPNVDSDGYTDGTIQLFLENDGSAQAAFRFWGRGENDANEVLYVLWVDGDYWDAPFPPAYQDPASMESTQWTLSASNKRQEKDAGSCLDLPPQLPGSSPIIVTVERLTP
jgi:hypothetical protein